MATSYHSELNHFPTLRYDAIHLTESATVVLSADRDSAHPDGSEHMDVSGINPIGRTFPVTSSKGPTPVGQPQPPKTPAISSPKDEVEISSMGKTLDNLSRSSSLRENRLAQIQTAIADGSYDTPEKLEMAMERLLKSHGLDAEA